MKIETTKLIEESLLFSKELLKKLKTVNVTHVKEVRFNSNEFRDKKMLENSIMKIDNSKIPIIYVISVDSKSIADNLITKFIEFWELNLKKTKNKDRVNVSRYNDRTSKVLYVGSSTTNFKARIKNHFGVLGSRVYSLHLSKWDTDLEYTINIDILKVESKINSEIVDRFVVEIIEQQLWEKLRPVFGKKSGL